MILKLLKIKLLSNAVPCGDDWLRFFVEWRIKAELNHQETTTNLKQGFEQSSTQQAQAIIETQR